MYDSFDSILTLECVEKIMEINYNDNAVHQGEDEKLVIKIQSSDETAFESLVSKYLPAIKAKVQKYSMLADSEDLILHKPIILTAMPHSKPTLINALIIE